MFKRSELLLNLTDFQGARVIAEYNDDDILEKGVFIPLRENGLIVNNKNQVCAFFFVNEVNDGDDTLVTHTLIHKKHKVLLDKLKEQGVISKPMGWIRTNFFNHKTNKHAAL